MVLPKGGRGHKAPYQTCTVRVPIPILDKVETLAEEYRLSVLGGSEFVAGGSNPTFDQALEATKDVLKQKRSAKQSIKKLLQLLYGIEVTDKMLE